MDGDKALDALQTESAAEGASDIHFSPEKAIVRLEIRLHGQLQALPPITPAQYEQVLRRIKFLAQLKLNITNIPQDGQYTFTATDGGDRMVNVRVATLPTKFGETVTLRLLDPRRGIVPLKDLGFPADLGAKLSELARMPNGIILVTGPTGSGKTTTLYAMLSSLIGTARNIITLEDPIEYEIPGIVQSQIDPDHGFTFAAGLRSVLRHDPNVILVGEIRDLETAQTAIDAALTGHLVLSTLHTNSAVEAIPRLLTMGVSPYTFAPALRAIVAQRLVRTLSPDAAATTDPTDPRRYSGRTVLPELLVISQGIRDLILAQEQETALTAQAAKEGFLSMKDYGQLLVQSKITTQEEIARVTT